MKLPAIVLDATAGGSVPSDLKVVFEYQRNSG